VNDDGLGGRYVVNFDIEKLIGKSFDSAPAYELRARIEFAFRKDGCCPSPIPAHELRGSVSVLKCDFCALELELRSAE